jgi:hypothetical protein
MSVPSAHDGPAVMGRRALGRDLRRMQRVDQSAMGLTCNDGGTWLDVRQARSFSFILVLVVTLVFRVL